MKSLYVVVLSGCLTLMLACKTKKEITFTAPEDELMEELLDTLVITDADVSLDELPREYRPSATQVIDILHTRLELSFDWQKKHVLGKAELTLRPYFKPVRTFTLDAVGFDIHSITYQPIGTPAVYTYDGQLITIELDREYNRQEKLTINIQYTAKPDENQISGSAAITENKGLFFIDPSGTDPDLPTQIWTQGETEHNSRWFPTFDKPIERFTQEILLTVENKYQTLSNGKKMWSKINADGTRTDYWKQEKPHAPYLAMIAVGEFDDEADEWNGIPLHYMVEKGFGKHARKIFNHTPEMLSFFTDKLGYPYPWDKYSQIVVRDFVSGAMENTGAVVFGQFVQKTDRELIDNDNDYIVAHEIMHHWFGNLVTLEDWSNLTLNEGFANYAEYLWFEHKYGKNRAELHRLNETNGYLSQVYGGGARPLVHYYYDDKEDMFDAHSYNKGGLVLHMLRSYVGDDAFFTALNKYLVDNALTSVEVDELRMAFEDVTGEDLHWFFDQWFLGTGHPTVKVKYTMDPGTKTILVEVDQSETKEGFTPYFKLPVQIALYYADGSVSHHPVFIQEKTQRILLEDLKEMPQTIVFDGQNVLLAEIQEEKTPEQYMHQFRLSKRFLDKLEGFSYADTFTNNLISQALADSFYYFRAMGIRAIEDSTAAPYLTLLQEMAVSDIHSEVRKEALAKLLQIPDFDPMSLCQGILNTESSYGVLQLALEVAGSMNPDRADSYLKRFMNDESDQLAPALALIMQGESEENLQYLETKAKSVNQNSLLDYYLSLQKYLEGKSFSVIQRMGSVMHGIAGAKQGNIFRKFMATGTLLKMAEDLLERGADNPASEEFRVYEEILMHVSDIVQNETHPILIEKYQELR
jgi:aminopeptidase N